MKRIISVFICIGMLLGLSPIFTNARVKANGESGSVFAFTETGVSIEKGKTHTFQAALDGQKVEALYTVAGADDPAAALSAGTVISNGTLTVGADENNKQLTVTATATINDVEYSTTATVAVTETQSPEPQPNNEIQMFSNDESLTREIVVHSTVDHLYREIFYVGVGMTDEEVNSRVTPNSTLTTEVTMQSKNAKGDVVEADGPMYIELAVSYEFASGVTFTTAQQGSFVKTAVFNTSNLSDEKWKSASIVLDSTVKMPSFTLKVIEGLNAKATNILENLQLNVQGSGYHTITTDNGAYFNSSLFQYFDRNIIGSELASNIKVIATNRKQGYKVYAKLDSGEEQLLELEGSAGNCQYTHTFTLPKQKSGTSNIITVIVKSDTDTNDTCSYTISILRKQAFFVTYNCLTENGGAYKTDQTSPAFSYNDDSKTLTINSGYTVQIVNPDYTKDNLLMQM